MSYLDLSQATFPLFEILFLLGLVVQVWNPNTQSVKAGELLLL